jgi:hypothetical protein
MARYVAVVALAAAWLPAAASTQAQEEQVKCYHIVNINSGKVLDVEDASLLDHAHIVIATKTKSESQQWKMVKVGDHVKFFNRNSGKVLDVPKKSEVAGTEIIQYKSNSGDNQLWTLEEPQDAAKTGICIKSVCSGLVLDVADGSTEEEAHVIQGSDYGEKSQRWKLVEVEEGGR